VPVMQKKENPKRTDRFYFHVSKEEKRAIENYLKKYKITNRSRWIRETVISFIIQKQAQDYPTLFNEQEMRR